MGRQSTRAPTESQLHTSTIATAGTPVTRYGTSAGTAPSMQLDVVTGRRNHTLFQVFSLPTPAPPYGCCDGKRRTATTRTTSVPTRGDDIAQSRATGDLRGGAYWRRSFGSPIRLEVCWISGRSGRLLCCRTKEQRQIMRSQKQLALFAVYFRVSPWSLDGLGNFVLKHFEQRLQLQIIEPVSCCLGMLNRCS